MREKSMLVMQETTEGVESLVMHYLKDMA